MKDTNVPVEEKCCELCVILPYSFRRGCKNPDCPCHNPAAASNHVCNQNATPCHKSVPVEKWEDKFSRELTDNVLEGGYGNDLITKEATPVMKFIKKAIQAARIEAQSFANEAMNTTRANIIRQAKVDRDDSWRAFLQKLAWKKEEIDYATEWVDRTPLRLRSNHSLESIINKHQ